MAYGEGAGAGRCSADHVAGQRLRNAARGRADRENHVGDGMIVYRVSSGEYETRLWNGNGGLNFDGRWNTKGHRIVYTSECLALAVLENLVNIGRFSRFKKYCKARAEIPDKFIIEINESRGLGPGFGLLLHQ